MSFFVERVIIRNRAPFESIDLIFKDKSISVLTAFNGKGKTTILSYIVDACVEMTRAAYPGSYEGRENSYYRISSPLYDIDGNQPSIVYIRFKNDGRNADYLDIRNCGSREWYESTIQMTDRIPYDSLTAEMDRGKSFKKVTSEFQNEGIIRSIFDKTLFTYFPYYRFELPNFLNKKYQDDVAHKLGAEYSGYLKNPLEVTSDIHDIANWILDVVLDQMVNPQEITSPNGVKATVHAPEAIIWRDIKTILECALISKFPQRNVRFGVGRRNSGTRLAIMEEVDGAVDKLYCPTIFNLSSGELSIIAIFAEILRRGDVTFGMIPMRDFHGIVLIDEVDKHLHIQLQKEVLPFLFNLFPNIQFVVSSHSPFLNMGLAEKSMDRTIVFDLDNSGIESTPTTNEVYEDAYKTFLNERISYAERYNRLHAEVLKNMKPLVITEGKTDIKHLKAAAKRLGIKDLDIEYFDSRGLSWGDSELENMVKQLSRINQSCTIIGIFDRDVDKYVTFVGGDISPYKCLGNNVFVFAIPLVNEDEYGNKISIEHYYHRKDLLIEDNDGRRLFVGDEFYESGNSKDSKYQTKISNIKNKVEVNGIIDEKVFLRDDLKQETSIACSKDSFAENLLQGAEWTKDFDFSNFTKIFNVIRSIISTSVGDK